MPLLEIQDLQIDFDKTRAVDQVSLSIAEGETLCLVGESGCGKSVTALSIGRLLATPPARYTGGRVLLQDRDVLAMSPSELRSIRGGVVSYIFQEPGASLNPVTRIGDQMIESLRLHAPNRAHPGEVVRLLQRVGIPAPESRARDYPHQLSGGMQQRVMIAMALATEPKLLIADEPTTALDVTIQAQVLGLMRQLRSELGTAIVLITHDLGVVAEMADRVVVMYAGQVVEQAPVRALFAMPQHPYTVGLMGAIPCLATDGDRLAAIDGMVPAATAMPEGCRFASRCPFVEARCRSEVPPLQEVEPGHFSRCWQRASTKGQRLDLELSTRAVA